MSIRLWFYCEVIITLYYNSLLWYIEDKSGVEAGLATAPIERISKREKVKKLKYAEWISSALVAIGTF